MKNPTYIHTFDGQVKSIHVTNHTAYVVIGDTLTPIPYEGSLTFPLKLKGMSAFASPISQMNKAANPPGFLAFTTEIDGECVLYSWTGSRIESKKTDQKIHSLCHGPAGLIFAGLENGLDVWHAFDDKISFVCKTNCNGTIYAVRARTIEQSVRLFTKSQTSSWSVFNFQIKGQSFGETTLLKPFSFLYSSSWKDYGIFNENQSFHSISLGFDNEQSMRYQISDDIKDVGVWHGGLVFLLRNKRVIVVPCSGDIEQQESWTYIHDRPYGRIAVWGNKLLLVSGCSVYEYPLPK